MKNILKTPITKATILLLALLTFSVNIYADGGYTTLRTCRPILKKYRANSYIGLIGFVPLCIETKKNCGGVGYPGAACSEYCAEQFVWNNPGDPNHYEGTIYSRACVKGYRTSALYESLFAMEEEDSTSNDTLITQETMAADSIVFNSENKTATVPNINATFKVYKKDVYFSQMTITLFNATDNVTEADDEKNPQERNLAPSQILWRDSIRLTNSGLLDHQTLIPSSAVSVTSDDNYYYLKISKANVVISVPDTVAWDSIGVNVQFHASPNEDDYFKNAEDVTETKVRDEHLNFKVFPSPTSSDVNVSIQLPSDEFKGKNFTLDVYSIDGRFIKNISTFTYNDQSELNYNIPAGTLSQGQYYVLLKSGDTKLLKQFTVTN